MEIDRTGIVNALRLRSSGDRGWLTGTCPFCQSKDKLGVYLESTNDRKPSFHCFKASCGKSGSLIFLVRHIGRPELATGGYVAPMDMGISIEVDEEELSPKLFKPPIGFRRTSSHEYISRRGITDYQYSLYKFGVTKVDPKIGSDYVITLVEEDGKCVGYVSRSIQDKEYIDAYNKANPDYPFPRYKNSETDFSKLIFGIDEIVPGITHTVILTEGMYDKFAVDRKMKLYENDEIKCGSSFGTKFSDIQAAKLALKGIKNIVILYDAGVVDKSKKVSKTASSYFKTVKIGTIKGGDPDEVSAEEVIRGYTEAKSIVEYGVNELQDHEL